MTTDAVKTVVFTQLADGDLDTIFVTIGFDNEPAAHRFVDEFHDLTRKLLAFPQMGRDATGLRTGARAFVHGHYLLVYRQMPCGIAVLRIVHGARELALLEYPSAPGDQSDGRS